MLQFVFEMLIVLSLSVVLYLFARTLPRVSDELEVKNELRFKEHWFVSYLEKTDEWLKIILEKLLRRIKVWILKLDNVVSDKLGKFKKESQKDTKQLPVGEEKKENTLSF